jgi:hypothetical protein
LDSGPSPVAAWWQCALREIGRNNRLHNAFRHFLSLHQDQRCDVYFAVKK